MAISRDTTNAVVAAIKLVKVEGAIECLQGLLDHCASHTIPIDEDQVYKYLLKTKKAKKGMKREWIKNYI